MSQPPRIFIYEGESVRLGRWVEQYRHLETGGELLGQYLPSGAFVVHLVTGPGPHARRTATSFHQDAEYMHAVATEAFSCHALQHGGAWHSHHSLTLAEPSGGDSATMVRTLADTGLASLVMVIANLADARGRPSPMGAPHVRGFSYGRARGEDYRRMGWTVLPGESPVRASGSLAHLLPEPRGPVSRVALHPMWRPTSDPSLRATSWARQDRGVALLGVARAALAAHGDVRFFPGADGLLEMHVQSPSETWVATFADDTTVEATQVWLGRRSAPAAAPQILRGHFEQVVEQLVDSTVPAPGPDGEAEARATPAPAGRERPRAQRTTRGARHRFGALRRHAFRVRARRGRRLKGRCS